jgi:hypothetical protein
MLGVPGYFSQLLFVLGSLALMMIFAAVARAHPAKYIVFMALGALALLIGNVLWLAGRPLYSVVAWWSLFLIHKIAGERLELGRLRQLPARVEHCFTALVVLLLVGTGVSLAMPDLGTRTAGVGTLALACWLLQYDIARRTIRKAGLTRYIAVCLLSGYVWLGLGGLAAVVYGFTPAGPIYDAMLHTIFIGFTFSMIFGHAPIIVPAVLGIQMRFSRAFYAHLALLHLSLAFRILGDLAGFGSIRRWGGLLNAVTLVTFLLVTVWFVLRGRANGGAPQASTSIVHESAR